MHNYIISKLLECNILENLPLMIDHIGHCKRKGKRKTVPVEQLFSTFKYILIWWVFYA